LFDAKLSPGEKSLKNTWRPISNVSPNFGAKVDEISQGWPTEWVIAKSLSIHTGAGA
jgi:hypothetical protein